MNEKYNEMISVLQRDVDALKSKAEPISPESGGGGSRRRRKEPKKRQKKRSRRGTYKDDCDDADDSDYSDGSEYCNKEVDDDSDDDESIESKFSYVTQSHDDDKNDHSASASESEQSEESDDDESVDNGPKKKRRSNENEVIEIDLSGSSSSDSSSSSSDDEEDDEDDQSAAGRKDESVSKSNHGEDDSSRNNTIEEEENDSLLDKSNEEDGLDGNQDTSNDTLENDTGGDFQPDNNNSTDDSDDEDDNDGEIKRYHVSKIKQSKLAMAVQGFKVQARGECADTDDEEGDSTNANSVREEDHTPFDPSSVEYRGKTFQTNRCYLLNDGKSIVGIKHFVSDHVANCVLVVRFEDTFLGTEEEGLEYEADFMLGTHVQVYKHTDNISLSKLERESDDVTMEIPKLIYQPQTEGDWNTFGYFYDPYELMQRRVKRRTGPIQSLECFAGAGGSLQGYKNHGFETVVAIDNDKDAISTLKRNNPGLNTYEGDIRKFKEAMQHGLSFGRTDNIHWSSPCQDFSQANRALNGTLQVQGKRDRADLSLLLVDFVQLTSCSTAVFENVVGIYQRKNVHYLKNIAKELMKLGYQVRCTILKACDYGDSQKRPRFFMFISKENM